MRFGAALAFVVVGIAALSCGTSGPERTRTGDVVITDVDIADDFSELIPEGCAVPSPSGAPRPQILDVETDVKRRLGWDPLRAGPKYDVGVLGWNYGWTCDGAEGVSVQYIDRQLGASFSFHQGIRDPEVAGEPSNEAEDVGKFQVQFLEVGDGAHAIFPMLNASDGSLIYADVWGPDEDSVKAFIRSLH